MMLHDAVSISDNTAAELGWFVKDYSVRIWKETVWSNQSYDSTVIWIQKKKFRQYLVLRPIFDPEISRIYVLMLYRYISLAGDCKCCLDDTDDKDWP
jgi:hypothetical protein